MVVGYHEGKQLDFNTSELQKTTASLHAAQLGRKEPSEKKTIATVEFELLECPVKSLNFSILSYPARRLVDTTSQVFLLSVIGNNTRLTLDGSHAYQLQLAQSIDWSEHAHLWFAR